MFTLTSSSATITLPNPEFGNSESVKYRKIQRETRGKTLIIGGTIGYKRIQRLSFSFTYLKDVQAQALLTFVKANVGKLVDLVDFEDNSYNGFIVTPDIAIIQSGRFNKTTRFEFESLSTALETIAPTF